VRLATHRNLCAALLLLWGALGAVADADLSALMKLSNVAILPFANLAETPDATVPVMMRVRSELTRKTVALADSNSVAGALRKYRVRNTSELDLAETQSVALESSSRYLLTGSIDRYATGDSTAEVALSARLLDVGAGTIVWANSVALHKDPRVNFLGLGSHRVDWLAKDAVHELFESFRLQFPLRMKMVQAIRQKGKTPPELPCRKVLLVTFGNESDTHFAGNILANELLSAMLRRGFTLVDPGRVRETMLDSRELMQGEISTDLLKKCRDELGADFVLTGTVSRFESVRDASFDDPAVAFEARLVDTQRGDLVWAKTYTRDGRDAAWMFDIGFVHGLAVLSEHLSRHVADDLPVRRARMTHTTPVQEQNP